ncbi:calmodulin-like 3 [Physocladia obscura]|uniref:Calmodulin-like 3 n=1 Tax=Physocladia obscura TaxID=109957 RepID=A0AAD5T0J5_9FUNG|nr:calmodulin-like 3 [Physocladia obscura]
MSSELTEVQTFEFKAAFAAFDRNNDGHIDVSDLSAAIRSLGHTVVSEADVGELVAAIGDKKGSVSFAAFMAMAAKSIRDVQAEEEMKEAFRIFDRNADGFITHDEFKATLEAQGDSISDQEVDDLIKECDVDGDGKLNYEEFSKMMTPPKHL